ncbi:MAG: hypothetical protein WAP74_02905 [Patescibacteria group bacterium]
MIAIQDAAVSGEWFTGHRYAYFEYLEAEIEHHDPLVSRYLDYLKTNGDPKSRLERNWVISVFVERDFRDGVQMIVWAEIQRVAAITLNDPNVALFDHNAKETKSKAKVQVLLEMCDPGTYTFEILFNPSCRKIISERRDDTKIRRISILLRNRNDYEGKQGFHWINWSKPKLGQAISDAFVKAESMASATPTSEESLVKPSIICRPTDDPKGRPWRWVEVIIEHRPRKWSQNDERIQIAKTVRDLLITHLPRELYRLN